MVGAHPVRGCAALPVVDVVGSESNVIAGDGLSPDLRPGTYTLRVRTETGLSNGDDTAAPTSFDDLAPRYVRWRAELRDRWSTLHLPLFIDARDFALHVAANRPGDVYRKHRGHARPAGSHGDRGTRAARS